MGIPGFSYSVIMGWYEEGSTSYALGALIDALDEGLRGTIVYGNRVLLF